MTSATFGDTSRSTPPRSPVSMRVAWRSVSTEAWGSSRTSPSGPSNAKGSFSVSAMTCRSENRAGSTIFASSGPAHAEREWWHRAAVERQPDDGAGLQRLQVTRLQDATYGQAWQAVWCIGGEGFDRCDERVQQVAVRGCYDDAPRIRRPDLPVGDGRGPHMRGGQNAAVEGSSARAAASSATSRAEVAATALSAPSGNTIRLTSSRRRDARTTRGSPRP